jgi:hypothetical protein
MLFVYIFFHIFCTYVHIRYEIHACEMCHTLNMGVCAICVKISFAIKR